MKFGLREHFHLYWLQAVMFMISLGFVPLLYLYFFQESISLVEIFLAEAVLSLCSAVFVLLWPSFKPKRDMALAFGVLALGFLCILAPPSRMVLYAFFLFRGLASVLFHIPYSILFFQHKPAHHHLEHTSHYFLILNVAALIGPLLAGVLMAMSPTPVFFSLGGLVLLFSGLYMIDRLPAMSPYTYSVRDCFEELKDVRLIMMMDGALHRLMMVAVPVFTLFYIEEAFDYGLFLGLLRLVALACLFVIARYSDRSGKRMPAITVVSLLAALATIGFFFAHSFVTFLVCVFSIRILATISSPMRTNVLEDAKPESGLIWICRAFYLDIGRAIILLACVGFIFIGHPRAVFLLFGGLHAAFPLVLWLQGTYKKAVL